MSSALPRSLSAALRGRSGLGLLIVGLILAQILLFGSNICPVRPGEFVRGNSGRSAPDDLQLLTRGTRSANP
ncbi:hypothetical protein Oter_1446 [Opitutus terrae PB90-1]|uniref:Uncharacterized protein n=1 Tax=Opitutus terrae (strain DSM 11246 / JCM 15787 / PB90-1) TaxID=452637 RepID=B1ZS55_OPITP|nr:hypothetical protein Oter_1446 [Opitutus terrae PB90-1]